MLAADADIRCQPTSHKESSAMTLFNFNLISGSVAVLLLVGGYAFRERKGSDVAMVIGVFGLVVLILNTIVSAAS